VTFCKSGKIVYFDGPFKEIALKFIPGKLGEPGIVMIVLARHFYPFSPSWAENYNKMV
jgi:hypothetical protein